MKTLKIEDMKTRIFSTVAAASIALVMLMGTPSLAKGKELKMEFRVENAVDPMLKVESWMFNSNLWDHLYEFDFSQATDAVMSLEAWMWSDLMWERADLLEPALALQPWMLDESNWSPARVQVEDVNDEFLGLEPWMTEPENWR